MHQALLSFWKGGSGSLRKEKGWEGQRKGPPKAPPSPALRQRIVTDTSSRLDDTRVHGTQRASHATNRQKNVQQPTGLCPRAPSDFLFGLGPPADLCCLRAPATRPLCSRLHMGPALVVQLHAFNIGGRPPAKSKGHTAPGPDRARQGWCSKGEAAPLAPLPPHTKGLVLE